jgi:PAS domain S-box-containing protein
MSPTESQPRAASAETSASMPAPGLAAGSAAPSPAPPRSAPWNATLRWAGGLTLLLVLVLASPAAWFHALPVHYLPLHTALEVLSIVVSGMVFALAWNLRHQADSPRALILGTAFLAVGLIDLAHTMSYAGMPDLVTPSGAEKAINFWLAGRSVAALALLAAALSRRPRRAPALDLAAALVLAAFVWWAGLHHADRWPRTFVEGQGLTAFKVGAEYLLAALYGAAAMLLYARARREHSDELAWLAAAAWVQGLAELYFTLYLDVSDTFNLLGHLYKVAAYLMVYRALFVAGVQQPHRELSVERSRLKTLVTTLPDLVWLKDAQGVYLSCNSAFERLYGAPEADIVGKTDRDFVDAGTAEFFRRHDQAAMDAGGPTRNEEWLTFAADGYRGLFETTKTPMHDAQGRLIGVLGLAHEITHQRALQQDLHQRNKEIRCLYRVVTITEDIHAPLAAQLQAVVERLPAAWQYPAQACTRIVVGDATHVSAGFAPTPWRQAATIPLAGDPGAVVELFYRQASEPAPQFLAEEQHLLDAVAARLASVVGQREVRRHLHEREAVFQAIADQAEDSIALVDLERGRFIEFNDGAPRTLGYSREEFARLSVADVECRSSPRKSSIPWPAPVPRARRPSSRVIATATAARATCVCTCGPSTSAGRLSSPASGPTSPSTSAPRPSSNATGCTWRRWSMSARANSPWPRRRRSPPTWPRAVSWRTCRTRSAPR